MIYNALRFFILSWILMIISVSSSFATEQKRNILIYNGDKYFINLELSLKKTPLNQEKIADILSHVEFSTGNWMRNPYITYQLIDKKLFIENVYLDSDRANSVVNELFPNEQSKFLATLSTSIVINKNYPSSLNNCTKSCILLDINNGEVTRQRNFTEESFKKHCNLLRVKNKDEKNYIFYHKDDCGLFI
jgi:hypothetical protein